MTFVIITAVRVRSVRSSRAGPRSSDLVRASDTYPVAVPIALGLGVGAAIRSLNGVIIAKGAIAPSSSPWG